MGKEDKYRQFERLYQEYAKAIFRFAYFRLSDYDSALDLAQDAFLRYWKVLSEGQHIRNPRAFLFLIAHGLVVDFYRKRKSKASLPLDALDDGRLLFHQEDLGDKLDAKAELKLIFSKLKEMKEEYRDVLLLYYVEDLPVSDIALILNKKENAVRVLIHRALKDLKERL